MMKDKINVPGPAKVMYRAYLGVLLVVLYSGFYIFHPFISGWRYPWSNALTRELNFLVVWALFLIAVVYLYYDLIGRPEGWNEPLRIFRIIIGVLTIWFWLLSYGVYKPFGWLSGFVGWLGGPTQLFKLYELFIWVMLLVNVIYIYARWAKSERFPHLFAQKEKAGEVD